MREYSPDARRLPVERRERARGPSRLGIAIGVIAAVLLVMNLRDISRYLKINNM
jgi:Family of unknown function (DUF6893)